MRETRNLRRDVVIITVTIARTVAVAILVGVAVNRTVAVIVDTVTGLWSAGVDPGVDRTAVSASHNQRVRARPAHTRHVAVAIAIRLILRQSSAAVVNEAIAQLVRAGIPARLSVVAVASEHSDSITVIVDAVGTVAVTIQAVAVAIRSAGIEAGVVVVAVVVAGVGRAVGSTGRDAIPVSVEGLSGTVTVIAIGARCIAVPILIGAVAQLAGARVTVIVEEITDLDLTWTHQIIAVIAVTVTGAVAVQVTVIGRHAVVQIVAVPSAGAVAVGILVCRTERRVAVVAVQQRVADLEV